MAKKPKKPAPRGRDDASAPACQDPQCRQQHFVMVSVPLPDGSLYYLCMRCWLAGARANQEAPAEVR